MKKRHTILVVDDEPDVVESVQSLLRLEFKVLGATRAADGLQLLKREEIHVVMSDQRMPGMSGVEFLSQIKGEHPEAVRLLFTGFADLKAVIDAINQGSVYRYITKPWDPDELQAVMRQAAQQYDLLVERKQLLAELQAKNKQLERANEIKEAFIRVASHELRTPLTILYGLTQLAVGTPELQPPLSGWLGSINNAAERLTRLVTQIVQMLQLGRFERPVQRQPTDLAKLLAQTSADVQPFVEKRRQQLVLDLPPDLGNIDVETELIRDGIDHLLLNAIKFTPDEGRILVRASRAPDGAAHIEVSDSGVGIEPANLKHIFDLFFTSLDVSRHSSGHYEFGRRGLGLGLSVVKAFVELHGGTVQVASSPGQGTTFTVTLPQTDSLAATRPASIDERAHAQEE